jgi:hypothetical protein
VNKINIQDTEKFYKTVWSQGGPGTLLDFEIERNNQIISLKLTTMDRNDFFVKPKYY